MLGLPAAKVAKEYWMPIYESGGSLNYQLRIGNVENQPTTITVYLGSNPTPIDSFTLAGNAGARKSYAGSDNGPLHIVSSTTDVLVSVRELFTTFNFESYYELLAFPDSQLATSYLFPWYNNVAFLSELRIAVP